MVFVIGGLLAIAIFAALAYPVLRPAVHDHLSQAPDGRLGSPGAPGRQQRVPAPAASVSAQETLAELLAQRDAAFQAIRELRFDHEVGKITGEDLAAFEPGLRQRAADSLQRLDVWETEVDQELARHAVSVYGPSGVAAARRGAGQGVDRARSCPVCGQPAGPADAFCTACGSQVAPGNLEPPAARPAPVCPRCGKAVAPDDRFCPRCGQLLAASGSVGLAAASDVAGQ